MTGSGLTPTKPETLERKAASKPQEIQAPKQTEIPNDIADITDGLEMKIEAEIDSSQSQAVNEINTSATLKVEITQVQTQDLNEELEFIALNADAQFVEEELPPDFWSSSEPVSPPIEKAIDAQLPSQATQQAKRLPEKAKQDQDSEAKQILRESTNKITTGVINSQEAASFEELYEASEDFEFAPDDILFAQLQTLFPGQILEIEEVQKEEAEELTELPIEVEPEFEA